MYEREVVSDSIKPDAVVAKYDRTDSDFALFVAVREVVADFQLTSLEPTVRACAALVDRHAPLDVAVLGQFKSGKSSLLNALIGRDILPVGVIPVTAVITRLTGGPKATARVTGLDGRTEEIHLERVAEFVTETLNPDNRRQVAVVDAESPELERWPGLRLVDTPGLGSTFGHNSQMTKEWLPNVAAALVVISADRPLAEDDRLLIEEVARLAPRVWIIVSKVDLLDPAQQVEVIEFLESQLSICLGRKLPVLPFSIRQDRDRHLALLQEEILGPLVENPAHQRRTVFRHKVRSVAESSLALLQVALRAAERVSAERERLRSVVLDETVQERVLHDELAANGRQMQERIRSAFEARFHGMIEPIRRRLISTLREEMRSWKGNLDRQARRYEAWLRDHLGAELNAVANAGAPTAQELLGEGEVRFRRVAEAFRDRLGRNVTRELNVSLAPVTWELRTAEVRTPDVSFSKTFDTNWDLLWWAIPMSIFGPLFHRHFLSMIAWEVEKNIARLVSQWHEAVAPAIDGLRQQAFDWARSELATLSRILDRQSDEVPAIENAIRKLTDIEGDRCGQTV